MNEYEDIIHLPHHVSKKHPQMSMSNRAAQFSPFAALTGYDAAVEETARLTDRRIELDEYEVQHLDERIQKILEHCEKHPKVSITYFLPDTRKDGGEYITVTGNVKKIDNYDKKIILTDGTSIPVHEIIGLDGDLFKQQNNSNDYYYD